MTEMRTPTISLPTRAAAKRITVLFTALVLALCAPLPAMADVLLHGSVSSAAGEKMGGVTISAKELGKTITTTVFTDETGAYVFPALPDGQYRVWAQAIGFATAKIEIALGTVKQHDFSLAPIKDTEQRIIQMPGDLILAGLPGDTRDDLRMKQIFRNNCTSCHTPSYTLQHRFDEAGWNAVIGAMKSINVYGFYRPNAPINPVLDFHQKELAHYLAKARGPDDSAFHVTTRPRPSGEAARVVFREYDIPLNPDQDLPSKVSTNDGSDWMMGTPSRVGSLPHDAAADFDGNLWFAVIAPTKRGTVGRIDAKTGDVKFFRVAAQNGTGRRRARSDPRRQGHDLVQRLDAARRPRADQPEDREDRRIPAASRNVAGRGAGDDQLRWPGRNLGHHGARCAAARSRHGAFHRIPLGHGDDAQRRHWLVLRHRRHRGWQCAGGPRWRSTPSRKATSRPARPRNGNCRRSPKRQS